MKPGPLPFTAAEKLECVKRELLIRKRAYPGKISVGRISARKAAREIAIMIAIIEDYTRLSEYEDDEKAARERVNDLMMRRARDARDDMVRRGLIRTASGCAPQCKYPDCDGGPATGYCHRDCYRAMAGRGAAA